MLLTRCALPTAAGRRLRLRSTVSTNHSTCSVRRVPLLASPRTRRSASLPSLLFVCSLIGIPSRPHACHCSPLSSLLDPDHPVAPSLELLCRLQLIADVLVVPSHFPADPCRLMLGWAAGGCAVSRLSRRISFLRWGCPVVWVACTVSYPLWCKKPSKFLNETVS